MNFHAILAIAFLTVCVYADDSCPPNSKGVHPKCLCNNDKPYDSVNRVCAIEIVFKETCPRGSDGIYPHCTCPQGKVYDPLEDVCMESDRSVCPKGAKKVDNKCVCENDVNGFAYALDEVFWTCRPWYLQTSTTSKPSTTPRSLTTTPTSRCGYHQSGTYPNCKWDPCPEGYAGEFWPDCTACGAHQNGIPPNCTWLPCPKGWKSKTGFYPDCIAPPTCKELGNCPATCPPYTRFANDKCEPIPCRAGTVGDFEPNCKHQPKCPAEYPGVWPNCNIYSARVSTTPQTPKPTPTTPRTTRTTWTTSTTPSTPRPSTTPRTTWTTSTTPSTPRPSTTPSTPRTTWSTPTTPSTPRPSTTPSTPRTTWSTPRTTTRMITTPPPYCYCECSSNDIIKTVDGKEIRPPNPFRYLPAY